MARFFDDILDAHYVPRDAKERLREATNIVADQVTEYFYAVNDQEYWSLEHDFPNLAPPFDTFWIESRPPTRIVSKEHGVRPWDDPSIVSRMRPKAWGAFFRIVEKTQLQSLPGVITDEALTRIKWAIKCTMIVKIPTGYGPVGRIPEISPVWEWIIGVREDGSVMKEQTPFGEATFGISYPLLPQLQEKMFKPEAMKDKEYWSIQQECTTYLQPLLLAVCFMHCKNIVLERKNPPAALRKKQARKHDRVLNSYYNLEITPIKKIIEASRNGQTGIKQALSRCRGHFKTYTPERPLLGKAVGRFFWAEHARGSKQHGVVGKDYIVKTGVEKGSNSNPLVDNSQQG